MTGQPRGQKTGKAFMNQGVTVTQQLSLMAELDNPVEIVWQTLGLAGRVYRPGAEPSLRHRFQARPRHINVAHEQLVNRQPADQERCHTRNRFIDHDMSAYLPPDVQQHRRGVIPAQAITQEISQKPRKYHRLPVLYHSCRRCGKALIPGNLNARSHFSWQCEKCLRD